MISPITLANGLQQKPGARIGDLVPELIATFPVIAEVWRQYGAPQPLITSGNDSTRHRKNSLHYQNRALDLRGNNLPDGKLQGIARELQKRLGGRFRILTELFPRQPARDHIHLEFIGN
jgi:conjugal transfer mating pair stabilization protein TraG